MLAKEMQFSFEYIQSESKGWKKIFQVNGNQKRAATFILDKIDFK